MYNSEQLLEGSNWEPKFRIQQFTTSFKKAGRNILGDCDLNNIFLVNEERTFVET